MKTVRNGLVGILLAIGTGLITLSTFSYSVFEGFAYPAGTFTPRPTLPLPNLTPLGVQATSTWLQLPVATETSPNICQPPSGWIRYLLQAGDNLATIANLRGVNLVTILQGNCLLSENVIPGTEIFLPPLPTASLVLTTSPTSASTLTHVSFLCGPPAGWTLYTIQPGDTLLKISRAFRVSVFQLRSANCLVGDYIRSGSQLWVPNVPTSTFTSAPATKTPTASQTETATPTLPLTATYTLSPTSTFTETATIEPSVTETFTPTPSETQTSISTLTSTSTPSETPSLTPTDTDVPLP